MWARHNPRAPLGLIYYLIKRILFTNLHYYQNISIQGFPLSWSINSACSFENLFVTLLSTLNGKSSCWNRCHFWPHLAHQEIFCNKPRTLLSFIYVHLTQWAKLLPKHLSANFKHLLWIELVTGVIFVVLSSVNNDLSIYVLATGVCCEIRYVGTTELKNVPYISATATSLSVAKKPWCSDLRSQCSVSWRRANIQLKKTTSLIKKRHTLKH